MTRWAKGSSPAANLRPTARGRTLAPTVGSGLVVQLVCPTGHVWVAPWKGGPIEHSATPCPECGGDAK